MAVINALNYSKIELVDGVFYLKMGNGAKTNIFLYKYRRVDNYTSPEDIFITPFDYDLVVLDRDCGAYLYFTYNYISEAEEVF